MLVQHEPHHATMPASTLRSAMANAAMAVDGIAPATTVNGDAPVSRTGNASLHEKKRVRFKGDKTSCKRWNKKGNKKGKALVSVIHYNDYPKIKWVQRKKREAARLRYQDNKENEDGDEDEHNCQGKGNPRRRRTQSGLAARSKAPLDEKSTTTDTCSAMHPVQKKFSKKIGRAHV